MDELCRIARDHGLALIEDAAHALGARYRDLPVGSQGDFAIFSFQAVKQLTTGDGGMLVCRDGAAHRQAYRQRWFGIDREARKPNRDGGLEWPIEEIGFKYHMNDVAASLGLAQLDDFENRYLRRQVLHERYRKELAAVPGLVLLEQRPARVSACWLFTVRVECRSEFIKALRSRGIDASVWHPRIDDHPLFGGKRRDLPNQDDFSREQVSVPCRETLSDVEVDLVLDAVRSGW